jgi:glycosyltransferase involved in cell wall biosynthesis
MEPDLLDRPPVGSPAEEGPEPWLDPALDPGVDALAAPVLDLVVPVYDEQAVLAASVERLHHYLATRFPFTWRITIVDNASTDATAAVGRALAGRYERVRFVHLDRKGRGLALRSAWLASDADVVAYTDVDLSTDLDALLPLVAPLVSGHSDLAIGSRLLAGSHVTRGPRREFISRSYNLILHLLFRVRFHDAQCGFKALRSDVARALVPAVEDDAWFFDTELLLLAERNGLRTVEVPVDWVDDPDSRVDVPRTARDDLLGSFRMLRRFARGQGHVDLPPPPNTLQARP